jgi:hypothetical protein
MSVISSFLNLTRAVSPRRMMLNWMTPTPTYRLVTANPPASELPDALALGDEVLAVDTEEVAMAWARARKRVWC